jgi:uncharacterized protein
MFHGRRTELAALQTRIDQVRVSGRGQLLVVRGRRQVGKSALFTRFVEQAELPYLYFTAAKNSPVGAQLQSFASDAATASVRLAQSEALFGSPPNSWAEAFARVGIAAKAANTPLIVVLDEFPWATQSDPTLDGVLQVAWDRELQHLPILLVLIGSDVSIMDRLSDHNRPLFGRTAEVRINPLNPNDVSQSMASSIRPDQKAFKTFDGYLVTGGYPRLVSELSNSRDPYAFVLSQLSDESSLLCTFAQRILSAEFDDSSIVAQLLSGIGAHQLGEIKFGEMIGSLHTQSEATINRALHQLVDTKQVVSRDIPFGAPTNSRAARYRITDPYLRFWLRFIGPQIPNISRGRTDIATDHFARDWSTWRGTAIEPIVRESVFRLAPELGLESVSSVGGWWTRNNSIEVDIAGGNRQTVSVVGSIKWRTNKPISGAEVAHLKQDALSIPNSQNAQVLIASPSGVGPAANVDITLNAQDLLNAWT